jgi:hypothetical protein
MKITVGIWVLMLLIYSYHYHYCPYLNGKINCEIDKYAIIFDGSFTDHKAQCKVNLWKIKIL